MVEIAPDACLCSVRLVIDHGEEQVVWARFLGGNVHDRWARAAGERVDDAPEFALECRVELMR